MKPKDLNEDHEMSYKTQITSSLAVCISFFILGTVIGFPTIALPVLTREQVPSSNNDTSLLSQTVFLNEEEASAFVYMFPLIDRRIYMYHGWNSIWKIWQENYYFDISPFDCFWMVTYWFGPR